MPVGRDERVDNGKGHEQVPREFHVKVCLVVRVSVYWRGIGLGNGARVPVNQDALPVARQVALVQARPHVRGRFVALGAHHVNRIGVVQ